MIEEGIANGWCDETILFGTSLLHETEEKSKGKRHSAGRLRKSLTPTEEIELYPLMERRPLYAYETQRQPITCPVPYSIEKVSGKQEYVIPMQAGRETEIKIQAYEPNDAMEISVSCRSEVQIIKKVFSTDYKNQALAENLEKQYRSYRAAEKQLAHR